ncbi:hypothetical protein FRB99_007779 [Tulasnella sp. 403]|nr:hypothetical protein FRB99_007779 [Tulasnella sp. 403]
MSLLQSLPEDILFLILELCEPLCLLKLSATNKYFHQFCELPGVWKRAYALSSFPLPPPPLGSAESNFDYKRELVSAARLNANWTSPRLTPRSRRMYDATAAEVWLIRSRLLVTLAFHVITVRDLAQQDHDSYSIFLHGRPILCQVSEMTMHGTRGIVIAYTLGASEACSLYFIAIVDDTHSPALELSEIPCSATICSIGLGETDIALATAGGTLVIYNLETGARRSIIAESTIGGQTIAISKLPRRKPTPATAANEDDQAIEYEFRVLAAFPTSLDSFALFIRLPTPDSVPQVELKLLGGDVGARQPQVEAPSTPEESNEDEYDSDSTLNRIAHPTQVLDLQIGPTGKRAVAIQISSRTNDRLVWAYTLSDQVGDLEARVLGFTTASERSDGEAEEPDGLREKLRTHACRSVFDETTGPLRLVLALGATYGTFYFLSNHYATERRFQVLRTRIREFTARKLKPKWSSLTELEQTLSEEDVDGYNPRIVEVKDLDSGLRPR